MLFNIVVRILTATNSLFLLCFVSWLSMPDVQKRCKLGELAISTPISLYIGCPMA